MLVLVFAFCAIASGKSKKDKLVQDQNGNTELTLGSTFEFDDLEITVGKEISFDTLKNQFSDKDGSTVVRIPLTIKNLKDEEHHLNMFFVKIFGSKGTETDKCDSYFDDGMNYGNSYRGGRYMNRGRGYSRDDGRQYMIQELENLMNEAQNENDKHEIHKLIEKMKNN